MAEARKPVFLIVNDDGVKSPMILPMVERLSTLGTVRLVLPMEEQSWKGKSMTRWEHIPVERRDDFGVEAFAVGGTPADCANLGVHRLFPDRPDWLVAGINIGHNLGIAFVFNSGTLGAAFEGALLGLPALAFSHSVSRPMFQQWAETKQIVGKEADRLIGGAAEGVERLMRAIVPRGLPTGVQVLNINLPRVTAPDTPVRWTRLLNHSYDSLFESDGEGYRHKYKGDGWREPKGETDRDVIDRGEISITPLSLTGINAAPGEGYDF